MADVNKQIRRRLTDHLENRFDKLPVEVAVVVMKYLGATRTNCT